MSDVIKFNPGNYPFETDRNGNKVNTLLNGIGTTSLDAFKYDEPPAPKRVDLGWLPYRRTAAVASQGGLLKTTWVLYQAIELAKQGKHTIVVSAEDEPLDYHSKLYSALKTPGSPHHTESDVEIGLIAGHIHIIDVSGTGYKLYQPLADGGKASPWIRPHIINSFDEYVVGMVVFETASRLCHAETNEDFTAAVSACDHIAMALNTTSVLIHHTGKGQARDKIVDMYSGRGGSTLGDNTRSFVVFTKVEGDYKPSRVPDCPRELTYSGELIEVTHARNSFGPVMPASYIRAVAGSGPSPALQYVPSFDANSPVAADKRKRDQERRQSDAKDLLLAFLKSKDGPVRKSMLEHAENRDVHLGGMSRSAYRSTLETLVDEGLVVIIPSRVNEPTLISLAV